jgi:hypothetical protein
MAFIAASALRSSIAIAQSAKQKRPMPMHLRPFRRIAFVDAPEESEKNFVAMYRALFDVAMKLRRSIMLSNEVVKNYLRCYAYQLSGVFQHLPDR